MTSTQPDPLPLGPIAALMPRKEGHQFVVYGDACSGIPDAPHARNFARINSVIRNLAPTPEFILFLGDEISGLTSTPDDLRAQWRHWLEQEMSWLDRNSIPLWHTTSNHTTYNKMSEAVFRDALKLPINGPPGQEGLSYWVRRNDLLLVFVHTLWTDLGGEGHVESEWLREVLRLHGDARYKLVMGHHPVHSVNGFSGAYQRDIGPEHAQSFWDALVDGGVLAYFCGHILAFDVQVHRGVLQICTAGAGTSHRMPEGIEYLHCVQVALDAAGLRYQVLDLAGCVREHLSWPIPQSRTERWLALSAGENDAPITGEPDANKLMAFRFAGHAASRTVNVAQTLLSAYRPGFLEQLWIGIQGPEQRLTVIIGPEPGRSPHYWFGPTIMSGIPFDIELLIHTGMGPGGIICRTQNERRWSSLSAASPWGAERLRWPERWTVGYAQSGPDDRMFQGIDLEVSTAIGAAPIWGA